MRFLCLHGWGTSAKILQSQLDPLIRELSRDNSATFHIVEGDIEAEPGPGIEGYYEGPYFSFYKFPRTFEDDDTSMMEAYELMYDIIEEEGPFDGVLGFSHGGTLASGFLIHHAKTNPYEAPPFRCAVFMNSLPPFRMNPGENPVVDEGLRGYIKIPTVSVAGTKDFVYDYSLALHELCDPKSSTLVLHDKGHDIPGDARNVSKMAGAVKDLTNRAMYVW